MKKIIKKIVPEFALSFYHFLWSFFSALFYGFPSKDMVVVGITGTKGKSTSVFMLAKILESAGYNVGVSSSLMFKIGKKEWINPYHMTMVGRHRLQKLIYDAKKAGCKYFLIEVTSEGIKQNRHKFIDFDIACFTNLSEEHLEAHGGFENYKKTKGKLFFSLKKSKRKTIFGKKVKKAILANADDENFKYFFDFWADKKYLFGKSEKYCSFADKCFVLSDIKKEGSGYRFLLNKKEFVLNIPGEFNIYNAVLAISCADILGVEFDVAKKALDGIKEVPGRAKFVKAGQKFVAIVDLAHTPGSFEAIFKMAKELKKPNGKIISVFGSAGGGRDKWKRPKLGEISAKNSDIIILTNEDPYDEDPKEILNQIEKGIKSCSSFSGTYKIIENRKKAIKEAVSLAEDEDVVLFLGKGTERTMIVGKDVFDWDEEQIVLKTIKDKIYEK